MRCDVTDTESVNRAVAEVAAQQGPVQVLVNNAGITKDGLFLGMDEDEFTSVVDTNFLGSMRVTKAVVPDMVKARWGRIIFIGSVVGMWGGPGVANYSSSKSALIGLARSLAWELGKRNVTVNVVAPGVIDTDLVAHVGDQAARPRHGQHRDAPGPAGWRSSRLLSSSWRARAPATSPAPCCRSAAAPRWGTDPRTGTPAASEFLPSRFYFRSIFSRSAPDTVRDVADGRSRSPTRGSGCQT